jgi:hypothetical protein
MHRAVTGKPLTWSFAAKMTGPRDTPNFCQNSQACLVNLRCVSTAVLAVETAGGPGVRLGPASQLEAVVFDVDQ